MRTVIMLLGCVFCLSACTMMGPVPNVPVTTYTIAAISAAPTMPAASSTTATLLLSTPQSAPGYDSPDMLYMQVPYQLKSFANNRWVSPPADLLLPVFADAIRQLGLFNAVVTPPFSGVASFQLNVQLLQLQQEFMQPVSQVRLRVSATLVNTTTGGVLGNHVFEIIEPASGNNPYSGVLATNRAANKLAMQLAVFVRKTV